MPDAQPAPEGAVSFGARLRQLAAERGQAEAVLFLPADGGAQSISWAALDAGADGYARALASRGVGQGDVVGFALGNVPQHLILALAIWRLGATTLVLDPTLGPEAVASLKARSGAVLVLGGQGAEMSLSELEALAGSLPAAPVADRVSQPGKIVLSGGSTGLPKLIADDRPYLRVPGHSWGRVAPALGFRSDQTQLVCGAMSHNAPFTWAQNGLFEGNRLVLMERFDAAQALRAIDAHGVGFVMLVPTMMVRMLDRLDEVGATLDSLRTLYHTGAPCPVWLKQAWIDRLGPGRVTEMYGSGENTGQTVISGAEWLQHKGSVGRGFETEIRIYDADMTLQPEGCSGEIFMRPQALGDRGSYIGPHAPRPRQDGDGFQSIGDVGWLDGSGYLYLGGRRDDVINSGGVKVNPETVEAVLMRHPDVADAVVFGIADRDWGEAVACCVVAKPGRAPGAEALRAFCADHLAAAEVPKAIHLVADLPRDGFGKIRRKMLSARFQASAA